MDPWQANLRGSGCPFFCPRGMRKHSGQSQMPSSCAARGCGSSPTLCPSANRASFHLVSTARMVIFASQKLPHHLLYHWSYRRTLEKCEPNHAISPFHYLQMPCCKSQLKTVSTTQPVFLCKTRVNFKAQNPKTKQPFSATVLLPKSFTHEPKRFCGPNLTKCINADQGRI